MYYCPQQVSGVERSLRSGHVLFAPTSIWCRAPFARIRRDLVMYHCLQLVSGVERPLLGFVEIWSCIIASNEYEYKARFMSVDTCTGD